MTIIQDRIMGIYRRIGILKYRLLSDCNQVEGIPKINQPVQMVGKGKIIFKGTVNLGVYPSPFFLNSCIYLEARNEDSILEIEDGVWINNNTFLISAGPGIFIGKNSMLGWNCEVIDSDFHNTHPDKRRDWPPRTGKVIIGKNVMIGSNAKILKGVQIGDHCVIANSSIVTRSFKDNQFIYGNPAKGGLGMWDKCPLNQ